MRLVSLKNLHPDLKLGLVLVSVAVLLNVVGWSSFREERYAASRISINWAAWLALAGGIGGLAAIPVAIWVDRRPPHKMMAGWRRSWRPWSFYIRSLQQPWQLNALGMFVEGVGSAMVDSLVFYAIAVKGATRYKGTLIGALGMVFTMRLGERIFREWSLDAPMVVLGIGVALALVGRSSTFTICCRACLRVHLNRGGRSGRRWPCRASVELRCG